MTFDDEMLNKIEEKINTLTSEKDALAAYGELLSLTSHLQENINELDRSKEIYKRVPPRRRKGWVWPTTLEDIDTKMNRIHKLTKKLTEMYPGLLVKFYYKM